MTHRPPAATDLDAVAAITAGIRTHIEDRLLGKTDVIDLAIAVLLAQGHLLLEDVPGIGKTTLAKALASAIDGTVGRIQFTPDLMPSDVTGVSVYRPNSGEFEFHPGPVFANVVVADEINRASPKTQSALLEAMQEKHVTVDHTTYRLPSPFMVVATQNPVEMSGTFPLPEAQRDRFTAQISIGYPSADVEVAMIDRVVPVDDGPVTTVIDIEAAAEIARRIFIAEPLKRYVVDIVARTRDHAELKLGASPRSAIQWIRVAKARAAIAGRNYVLPDDIQVLAGPVLTHRLVARHESTMRSDDLADLVTSIIASTPLPASPRT